MLIINQGIADWAALFNQEPALKQAWRRTIDRYQLIFRELPFALRPGCEEVVDGLYLTPEHEQELNVLADIFDVPFRFLKTAQAVYDISTVGAAEWECGCSSIAMRENGRAKHARNLDWEPELAGEIRWLTVRDGDHHYQVEHIPGIIGWLGVRGRHVVGNLNQALDDQHFTPGLMPALLAYRCAWETGELATGPRDVPPRWDGATAALLHTTFLADQVSTVVEIIGEDVLVEERDLRDGPLAVTNNFQYNSMECDRWRRMMGLAARGASITEIIQDPDVEQAELKAHQWVI